MFTEDIFFRGLRVVLSLDQKKVVLGEVVIDVIKRDVIPQLQILKSREPDKNIQDDIQERINTWEDYADKSKKGRIWNIEAVKVIGGSGNKWGINEGEKEELAQRITNLFYKRPKLRNNLAKAYNKPTDMLKLFKKMIHLLAIDYFRSSAFKNKPTSLDALQYYNKDLVVDKKETPFDRKMIREIKTDLRRYVNKRLPSDQARLLFNLWMDVAENKGPDNIIIKKDIYPKWIAETGYDRTTGDVYFKKIKKLIANYLRDEQGIVLTKRQRKRIKGSSDAVAEIFIRRMLAKYILGS